MRFLPLAIATMAGEGVCVAGLDIDGHELVRLVMRGKRCLFTQQASKFVANTIHEVRVGERQPRDSSVDPEARHTEDIVLLEVLPNPVPIEPDQKLRLLRMAVDHDLRLTITAGGRSLFLVEPREYSYDIDSYGKHRFSFGSSVSATSANSSSTSIHRTMISVSQDGPACTCPAWSSFAERQWRKRIVTQQEVAFSCPNSSLFLLLSLSALYSNKYWLIAAGVHIVGEERIWV